VQWPCAGPSPVKIDRLHIGQEQQRLRLQFPSQQGSGQILVDNGLDPVNAARYWVKFKSLIKKDKFYKNHYKYSEF
jgi:hypothetical protein